MSSRVEFIAALGFLACIITILVVVSLTNGIPWYKDAAIWVCLVGVYALIAWAAPKSEGE